MGVFVCLFGRMFVYMLVCVHFYLFVCEMCMCMFVCLFFENYFTNFSQFAAP